jgi:hypothetical protein
MIHLKDRGPEVELWQNFLVGQGLFHKNVGGIFDQETLAATITFQRMQRVAADGIVGSDTYNAAKKLGFTTENNEDWPPKPTDFHPLDDLEKQKLFGRFQYKPAGIPNNPEAIIITDTWVRDNVVSVEIPQLKGVKGMGNLTKIQWNIKVVNQLLGLFNAWESIGVIPKILSWGGSFAPRFIRGSRSKLSNHSYATAFDINVSWNYMGTRPALLGAVGSVRELVPLAQEYGFYWGGWYGMNIGENKSNGFNELSPVKIGGRYDGMHFEVAKIL